MKVAIMTRWNVPSGQSSHAEPVGRAWREMGHEVRVFAPKGMELGLMYQGDEPFVNRCYMLDIWGERGRGDYFFDARPFLEDDYEVLVVEDAEIMPMPELLGILPEIRKKAKTVLVVHEVGLPKDENWYRFEWDAIVCFDDRYREFVLKGYPETRVEIVPFPCHAPEPGERAKAREMLGLPLDRKIVFAYGYDTVFYHIDLLPALEKLLKRYPVSFVLLTHTTNHGLGTLTTVPHYLLIREEMPAVDRLYTYLHASDVYVYYGRDRIDGVGVSSCVATCLGAGRPVLVPGYCNFFDLSGKEVIKYDDLRHMEQRLQDVFEGKRYVRESLAAAHEHALRSSASAVARQMARLFEEIRREPADTRGRVTSPR